MNLFGMITLCLLITNTCISQETNYGLVSSNATTSELFSFSVGEIYVVETKIKKIANDFELNLSIFPNPVVSVAEITSLTPLKNKEALITNSNGTLIRRINLDQKSFLFNDLSPGIYFISSSSKAFHPIKFIKL